MAALARERLERQFGPPSAPPPDSFNGGPPPLRVRNDSDQELERFAVVGLDELIITASDNFGAFVSQPTIKAVKPQVEQHYQRFAVIQQPLRKRQIGVAVAHGPTVCKVDVQHTEDAFCALVDEQTGSLISGAGDARILSKLSKTGEQWAQVQLGAGGPQRWIPVKNNAGEEIPAYGLVQITSSTGDDLLVGQISLTGFSSRRWAAVGPSPIADGKWGLVTEDFPAWVLTDYTNIGFLGPTDESYALDSLSSLSDTPGGFLAVNPARSSPDRHFAWHDPRFLWRPYLRATLNSDLSTTDEFVAGTVKESWGLGADASGTVQLRNAKDDSSGNYIFSGSSGDTAYAVRDYPAGDYPSSAVVGYRILWLECS